MPSITTWYRLEPRSRDAEMTDALRAAVHDPAWLLARQWQTGEFRGEDAGTPVVARWRGVATPFSAYLPGIPAGKHDGIDYDPGRAPLEAFAEAEPPADHDARLAADLGLALLRLLGEAGHGRYAAVFRDARPLSPARDDDDGARFTGLLAGRVPDGFALRTRIADHFANDPAVPLTDPDVDGGDWKYVAPVLERWLAWSEPFVATPAGSSWVDERVEYGFAVGAGDWTLVAREHAGGRLDWQAFDVDPDSLVVGAGVAASPHEVVQTAVPSPVSFLGMPLPRWWAFEDERVDFGAIDAGVVDTARLLLMEFALLYGNDFFLLPVELPVGAVCATASLVVTDTFGVRTLVGPTDARGDAWRMFRPATVPGAADPVAQLLVLPPLAAEPLHGEPVEQVLLLRDEQANLAWAVERRVEGVAGRATDRHETYQAARARAAAAHDAAHPPATAVEPRHLLDYRLATGVPPFWLPLVPVRTTLMSGSDGVRLELRTIPDESGTPVPPQGRLLSAGLLLPEEEVPREGLSVTRCRHLARWSDGSTHLWTGRRVGPHRGEGSSGLRHDVAEPRAT